MPMTNEEGSYLHLKLFGSEAPAEVLAQYTGYLATMGPASGCAALEKCRSLSLNVTAVEYALRLRNRRNTLTQRFEALSMLCEVHPSHYQNYYSDRNAGCLAYIKLGFLGFKAAGLLILGRYLIWRHSID